MTVSNVLRGNAARASEETRNRVLTIAAELEYVPVAQPMVQSRRIVTHIIGLVFDEMEIEQYWGGQVYRGLREGAAEFGYDLLIIVRDRHPWMDERGHLGFLDRRCDGMIFVTPKNRYETLKALAENELPVVTCFTGEVPPGVTLHALDNAGALKLAVERLVELGHERIAYLELSKERTDFTERLRGYMEAMALLSPGNERVISAEEGSTIWHDQVADAMAEGVTGFACSNDLLALHLMDFARSRGWRVPDDLSITGMDDIPEAGRRGLSTVKFSSAEVGRSAVESIARLICGEAAAPLKVVPVEWVERDTVAAPKL